MTDKIFSTEPRPPRRSLPPGCPRGFSLIEAVVVIVVLAIIALLAAPALTTLVPRQRLRGEAQDVAAFMRQARLKAANTQKPVRVVLDCASGVCTATQKTAKYDQGEVTGWTPIPDTRYMMDHRVRARRPEAQDTLPCNQDAGNHCWFIFMPNGRGFASHQPFNLQFYDPDMRLPGRVDWLLYVNPDSGRAVLNPESQS